MRCPGKLRLLTLAAALALGADAPVASEQAAAEEPEQNELALAVRSDQPIVIESEELEAYRLEDGRQRVVFRNDVKVVQEDLEIGCDWLEALYPKGGGEPERFTCRGNVRIRKAEVEAICDEALFDRARHEAVCTGEPAELRRGENVVQGPSIRFDTVSDKIVVKGGARIHVRPEESAE
jgi:lipopolysaccharide transport protein LptA